MYYKLWVKISELYYIYKSSGHFDPFVLITFKFDQSVQTNGGLIITRLLPSRYIRNYNYVL